MCHHVDLRELLWQGTAVRADLTSSGLLQQKSVDTEEGKYPEKEWNRWRIRSHAFRFLCHQKMFCHENTGCMRLLLKDMLGRPVFRRACRWTIFPDARKCYIPPLTPSHYPHSSPDIYLRSLKRNEILLDHPRFNLFNRLFFPLVCRNRSFLCDFRYFLIHFYQCLLLDGIAPIVSSRFKHLKLSILRYSEENENRSFIVCGRPSRIDRRG